MFLIVSKHDKKKAPDKRGFDGWGILNIWPMWCCAHRHFRSTFLEFVSAYHCCWVVHMHHNVALWKGRGTVHGYRSNLWHCLTANGWALSCRRDPITLATVFYFYRTWNFTRTYDDCFIAIVFVFFNHDVTERVSCFIIDGFPFADQRISWCKTGEGA